MKLYKKLLSGLCCATLLAGLLPVFPAAAAEPAIADDFERYSPARFGGNDAFSASDIANGSTISRQIKQNEGNKYLWFAAQNGESTTGTPRIRLSGKETTGSPFTVEFDYNTASSTRFDVYLRSNGAIRITVTDQLIPTIRVLDSAKVAGKMETTVGNAPLKTNHWYTFKAVTTNETITLEVFDKENGNAPVESLSIIQDNSTLATLFEPSSIWFDMWGYADKNITQVASVALDNVNVVSGTYEGLLNKDAKVGSIVGVTGDGLGSAVDLRDHECPSKNMIDVYISAWYHKAVDFALTNKLMGGYNAVQFGPNDTLTRAQVVQVLYNKEGQPTVSGAHGFTDVPTDQWFNNAITWGTQKKIMGGYGNGKFGPNDAVTLEQIAVILWQYSGKPEFTASADSVGPHSGWAANGLAWCVEKGILDGMPYDAVTDPATRAQTAQMLMNYLK